MTPRGITTSCVYGLLTSTVKGGGNGLLKESVSDGEGMNVKGGFSASYRIGTKVTGQRCSKLTGCRNWASLAILLTGHVLVAGIAAVVASSLQHFPLGTDHMVSLVLKASPGHHIGFLPRMDGNIGRDPTFLQDLSQPARIVGGVSCQRGWLDRKLLQELGHCLPFSLRSVGDSPR